MLQDFNGRVKGLKVEAVDTTGAGDAFVAGMLSQLALDLSLLQVLPDRKFIFNHSVWVTLLEALNSVLNVLLSKLLNS